MNRSTKNIPYIKKYIIIILIKTNNNVINNINNIL